MGSPDAARSYARQARDWRGCAEALAREGVDVTICARTAADVARAADEIGALAGRPVAYVVCDITTAEGREKALAACPQPDIQA